MRRLPPAALLGILAACGTPPTSLPERLEQVPDPRAGTPAVMAARQALDRGEAQAALDLLGPRLAAAPDDVEALRLRQDALKTRGRIGLLVHEAQARIAATPQQALGYYLRGRVAVRPEARLRWFEEAVRVEPASFWGWLGLAYALRRSDPERALQVYRELWRRSRHSWMVGLGLAGLLQEADPRQPEGARQRGEAVAVYEELRKNPDLPGVGSLGLAETLFDTGKQQGWSAFLDALRARPFDPGVRAMAARQLARGLGDDEVAQVLDLLRADPGRLAWFRQGGGARMLASLFQRSGNTPAALEALAPPGEGPPAEPVARRLWRRLALGNGRVREALDDLRATFPHALLEVETNQVRGVWKELFGGSWYTDADPLADLARAEALTRALLRAGLLVEAELVAGHAVARHPAAATGGIRAARDEVRRQLAFEGALQRLLYRGYAHPGQARSLAELLDDLRRISKEFLGRDVVGQPQRFTIPFLGELVDPFADGLARHFAAYNRHLVLGQRAGQPPEALLMVRLSLAELERGGTLPLPTRCHEVVGEDRSIRSLTGVYGGDLAGVALFHHYVIDWDAVLDWSQSLERRRSIVREDGMALLRDPVPEEVEADDPVDAHWRLAMVSPEEDSALPWAVLDMIRWHERAHLVDAFHYLPAEKNLWRVVGLLWRNGFSAHRVEGDLEGRAESAALACSPHTQLVLAHIASFLEGEDGESTHVAGFRRLALEVVAHTARSGAGTVPVSRWHELPPEAARAAAREAIRRFW